MRRNSSHLLAGVAFVLTCIAIGAVLFVLSRPAVPTAVPAGKTAQATPVEAPQPIALPTSDEAKPAQTDVNEEVPEPSQPQAEATATMTRLRLRPDMMYDLAKAFLIYQDYVPQSGFEDACSSIGEDECKPYPEIEECSGSGQGYCIAIFRKGDETVELTTYGPGGPVASAEFR